MESILYLKKIYYVFQNYYNKQRKQILSSLGSLFKEYEHYIIYYSSYLGLRQALYVKDVKITVYHMITFNKVI